MNWTKSFSASVTICDKEGNITYMNDQAALMFSNDGGYDLIGKSLYKCHKQSSNEKIEEIMRSGNPNAYTIEKKGIKKLIYQAPHIENGEIVGIVELSLEIPFDMPHHIRK
jgi:transcriptional regulator with PAS, ATPase and Fis domain